MSNPTLRFVHEPYDQETVDTIIENFREKGYATLPDLYVRESVDDFVQEIHDVMYFNGIEMKIPDDSPVIIWPGQAPRIRQILPLTLGRSQAKPLPSMYMSVWVIQPEDQPDIVPKWHKDREPEGMPDNHYHYPIDVFVGLYFEDMKLEHGPAKIIAGSHRDGTLNPYAEGPEELMICRKQDGILLDQRAWHCGTPRTAPGVRILACYGYYAVPLFYSSTIPMPRAQREAWLRAKSRKDQVFFGGIFDPLRNL